MFRRTIAFSSGLLLLVTTLGCGAFGDPGASVSRVDDLVRWVERVHVESEVALETVQAATRTLDAVTSPDYEGDPVRGYEELVAVIASCEAQADKLRGAIGPMKAAAAPVFEQWSVDLLQMSSVKMRLRSHMRMEKARERYDAVVATADPAAEVLHAFIVGLRDIALFLAHDFNATAVADLQDDVRALRGLAADLQGRFDLCLTAARDYIAASALPGDGVQPVEPSIDRGLPAQPGGAAPSSAVDDAEPRPRPPAVRPTRRPVPQEPATAR